MGGQRNLVRTGCLKRKALQDFRLNHSSVIPLLQISSLYRICPHFSPKPRPRYHTVNEGNEGEGLSNLVSKPQDNLRSANYPIDGTKLCITESQPVESNGVQTTELPP